MTKYEIAELLHIHINDISTSFAEAERRNPNLAAKANSYSKKQRPDFTIDEVIEGLQFCPYVTPMSIRYLKEHFVTRESGYQYRKSKSKKNKLNEDARKFIWRYHAENWKCNSCVTCIYLIPKAMNRVGLKGSPFCTFYNIFLNKTKDKMNIYQDRCDTFIRNKTSEPFIFTPSGPMLISKIGKVNTDLMGIDQSEFTSKREKGEPLIVLKDAFRQNY